MRKSLKIILLILFAASLIGALGLVIHKYINRYDEENYIGLTAEQIMNRYGPFDRVSFWDNTDQYRSGVYIVKPERVGFFGTSYEEYFVISFDENGVACECSYVYGGRGG